MRKIYDNPKASTRMAILSFGRKNGKTAFAAWLALLHLAGPESLQNSQIYSAAQSRDQAAVVFNYASKTVRYSPSLAAYVSVKETAKMLTVPDRGTVYRALSAEAKTAFGLSPAFIIHDELGQVRGPRSELYTALETATGGQENPLSIVISTQAPTDGDLLSMLIDDAQTGADPSVVLSLWTAPEDADPFAFETIKMANPAIGDFQNKDVVMKSAAEASRLPALEAGFRNYVLNQRVEANDPFISKTVWIANGAEPVDDFTGRTVYAGLDLSSTSDLTAAVYVSLDPDGCWSVRPRFWLPEVGLHEKARIARVPYDIWKKEGYLETTPGSSIEYEYVARQLYADSERMDFVKVAFDRWNFHHLKPWLITAGFYDDQMPGEDAAIFESFGQGFASMSPALRTTESWLLNNRIKHGNHPVLTMCASNAVVTQDDAGNRKLSKAKAAGRIDGLVALVMAVSVAAADLEEEEVRSPFEDENFTFV